MQRVFMSSADLKEGIAEYFPELTNSSVGADLSCAIKANLAKAIDAKPRVLASFREATDDTSRDPTIAGLPTGQCFYQVRLKIKHCSWRVK